VRGGSGNRPAYSPRKTCPRGEAQVPLWRQRWLVAANPSKWLKTRSNDHDPCGSRPHVKFHAPCGSPTPSGPTPTGPTPTEPMPTEPRAAGPNARGYGTADVWGLWGHGLGCRMDREAQRERGCRMDRGGHWERGCRMDRGRYCGSSTTLTDSPLPTSVVSKGEPALPLSGKFSSFLVVAFHSPVQ